MFGRVIRHILPNQKLEERQNTDEELRDRDQENKFHRNAKENRKRQAKEIDLKVGDKVLVMQEKREKSDTVYKNAFHKVLKFTGSSSVTVQDLESGRDFDRNIKHIKIYNEKKQNDFNTQSTAPTVEEEHRKRTLNGSLVRERSTEEILKKENPLKFVEARDSGNPPNDLSNHKNLVFYFHSVVLSKGRMWDR